MHDQPRYEALEASTFFEDGRSARPEVPGTVARGLLKEDKHFYTGKSGNAYVDTFPFPITREVLERGRERFEIFCAVCQSPDFTSMSPMFRKKPSKLCGAIE